MADRRLHNVHRLLEAVLRQLSIVLHLHQQARLHDGLRKHVKLIVVEIILHDFFSGLFVDSIYFLRLTLSIAHEYPILVLILQLSRLENDRLRKLLIQHVKLVSQGFDIFLLIISFQVLLDVILHFLLVCIVIGRLLFFRLLLV